MMIEALMVTLGAVVGGPARYLFDRWLQGLLVPNHPSRIPVGTLAVNTMGSATLGAASVMLSGPALALVGTGFCGSFTTFSTFAALSDESIREGWWGVATWNVVASVALCLMAFWATHTLFSGFSGLA